MDCVLQGDGVCSESINGGRDVWSSENSADHLVVMVNGILGSSTDWKFAAEQFVRILPDKVIVHCSQRNVSKLTLDGVDVMGERLAEEVIEVIKRKPKVRKISFISHSVGGLVARYAIGRLYRPCRREAQDAASGVDDEESRGTIFGLEAMNFITVATPHLGSRGNKQAAIGKCAIVHFTYNFDGSNPNVVECLEQFFFTVHISDQVPFLFGVTFFEKAASCVIHLIFRRTGRHLFLTDHEGGPPLLQRMVDDCGDLHFMSSLRAFRRRVAYSNVGCDHIVGWRTSSIRRNCELPKWEDSLSEKYPHVVYEEQSKGNDSEQCAPISVETDGSDMLEEELVTGLTRLSWERVDVSFHSSRNRFAAHSVIQVKNSFVHSEGADVILHMIDHFRT